MFGADTQSFLLDTFLTLNFVAQLAYTRFNMYRTVIYVNVYEYTMYYVFVYIHMAIRFRPCPDLVSEKGNRESLNRFLL